MTANKPAPTMVPVPRREVAWAPVDGDVVTMGPSGDATVLSGTGAVLWHLLDGSASIEELAADVAEVFGIAPDAAVHDVTEFVGSMTSAGLVGDAAVAHAHAEPAVSPPSDVRARRLLARPPDPWTTCPPDPNWIAQMTVRLGGHQVSLRSDDDDVFARIESLFDRWRVPDRSDSEAFGISVARRGGAGPRMIPALLHGRLPILRSRSLPRLLRRLDIALGEVERDGEPNLVPIRGCAAITCGGGAAVVPHGFAATTAAAERAVLASNCAIADEQSLCLDLATGELVVTAGLVGPSQSVPVDDVLLATPGRYEIRSVFSDSDSVPAEEPRAAGVTRLARLLDLPATVDHQRLLDTLVGLSARLRTGLVPEHRNELARIFATLRASRAV